MRERRRKSNNYYTMLHMSLTKSYKALAQEIDGIVANYFGQSRKNREKNNFASNVLICTYVRVSIPLSAPDDDRMLGIKFAHSGSHTKVHRRLKNLAGTA